jgi:hypothetical protein
MKAILATLIVVSSLSVFATIKVDKELNEKIAVASKLIKAASKQSKSVIEVTSAKRKPGGTIVVNLTETYEASDSGVMCTKSIEFSKNAEDRRLEVIKIIDGLCFS